MQNKLFKKAPILMAAFATAAALSFTACGDDSGNDTPAAPDTTLSSSSETQSGVTCEALTTDCYSAEQLCAMGQTQHCGSVQEPVQSSSSQEAPVQEPVADVGCAAGEVGTPVDFPQDDFTDIGDVYKNIQCNEKVIFIVRHAERDAQTGKESPLTADGVEAAVLAGQKLAGPGQFKFVNSGFLRTFQTVYYMAIGRGQYQAPAGFADSLANWNVVTDLEEGFVPDANFPVDTITQITDGWFLKDKTLRDEYKVRDSIDNVNEMYSKWIYEGLYEDVYYNLDERCTEVINNYLVKDYSEMPKYTLMGSHDQFLMPLLSWATQKKIGLTFFDASAEIKWRWVKYLAGIAIIVNDKNEIRYAPVRGMETGFGR